MKLNKIAKTIKHSKQYSGDYSIMCLSNGKIRVPENKNDLTNADKKDVLIGDTLIDRELVIKNPNEQVRVDGHYFIISMETEQDARKLYQTLKNEVNRRGLEEKARGTAVQSIKGQDIKEFNLKGWK